jgi:signal peptidase II
MQYVTLLLIIIGLDQVTKFWVMNSFRLYESMQIIPGFFNLLYARNTGVAFSMFAHYDSPWKHYFFIGVNIAAVVGLTIANFRMQKGRSRYSLPFAFIAAGAAGNVIDRLRFGSVIDFLDVYVGTHHWPTFNVADSAICVGVGLFLVINYLEEKKNLSRNKE